MTNQIIQVSDIAIIKKSDTLKQLFSLRELKVKKGALQSFDAGSGIKYNGDLYILNEMIPIVKMNASKTNLSFSVIKNVDAQVD